MKKNLIAIAVVVSLAACSQNTEETSATAESVETKTDFSTRYAPAEATRRLIAGAHEISKQTGEKIWPGWDAAPFGILLVGAETESLFCHTGPAAGWEPIGHDPITQCDVRQRPREFDPAMLASFPAVDGIPTIVIGTPEATGRTPSLWQLTLLHEHMHQLQYHWNGYYEGVAGLDLAGDDNSGMWMLNYPFPYGKKETNAAFKDLAMALKEAVNVIGTDALEERVEMYLEKRRQAQATVSPRDWRYFEFQLWQEGVARWTEIAIADSFAQEDNAGIAESAIDLRNKVTAQLDQTAADGLINRKRSSFYAIGAAEAMLLNSTTPEWRMGYFTKPFSLGPYFKGIEE